MIGKNNIYLRKMREGEKNESFSIKKFKVGAASVVIGASIFFGTGVASASNDGGKLEKDVSVEKVENTIPKKDVSVEKVENTIPKKDEGKIETKTLLNNSPKAVNENSKEEEVVEKQVLDKTKLQASIVKVEELLGKIKKDKVSASTLSAIQINLENAKSIFTNDKTSQDEIDRAVKKLNEQSFILSSMPKGETLDKVLKKNGDSVSNSGSHDSRNGQSMGVGSQFRADSSTTSGALTNIKYFASVNPRGTTRNNNPELTKTKTDIKSYYEQNSEGKWIVYDVFFNNNARRIVDKGQKQHYYFQLPFNIMDSSNTVKDLTFTRYKSVGGTKLSDGFDGFVQHGNEARISQGEVFAGQKDRIFNNDRYTMYDPNSGAYTDDRKKQVFKSNANDQTLNTAVRDKNGNYPRASYYLGLDIAPGENLDYAIHMHAKVKLKNDVTEAEANRYGRVFAATVGEQIASNESYVMYGTTALTPRDTTPPTITANNATVTKDEPITPIPVTAEDNRGGVGMRQNNPIEVTGLPAGLTYANNRITGTPTGEPGNSTVTIKAYDKNGNMAPKTITITVNQDIQKPEATLNGIKLTETANSSIFTVYRGAEFNPELKVWDNSGKVSKVTIANLPSGVNASSFKAQTGKDGSSEDKKYKVSLSSGRVTDTQTLGEHTATLHVEGRNASDSRDLKFKYRVVDITTKNLENGIAKVPVGSTLNVQNSPTNVDAHNYLKVVDSNDQADRENNYLPQGMVWTWKSGDNLDPGTTLDDSGKYTRYAVAKFPTGTNTYTDTNSTTRTTFAPAEIKRQVVLAVTPTAPSIVANKDGSVEITPPKRPNSNNQQDIDTITLTYTPTGKTDPETVTVTKTGNNWTVNGKPTDKVSVTPQGVVKIADLEVADGKEVSAKVSKTIDNNVVLESPVAKQNAKDAQKPTLTITPSSQTVVEGEKVEFTVTAKDNTSATLNANDFLNKYFGRVSAGKASYTPVKTTETEKVVRISITTSAEDIGKQNTITFNAEDNDGNNADPVNFNFTVTARDTVGPTITANGATVTKNEQISPISVTAVDNPGGVGLRDQDPVQVTGLPTGLSYANNQITGIPTAAKGDYPVTIKAYDKNDNPTTKTITIKVQDQTDKYNPTGAELTVNQNHVLTDAEITGKVSGYGPGTLTVLTKPSTATAGNAGNAVVRVTYPDTTNDIVTVRIKVKDVTGPSITANGATVTRKEAITAIPVTVADNTGGVGLRGQNPVQVTGLPTGLSYANNQITGTPTATKGDYPVTIKAYDKNDNPTTKTITIKVQDQTDKYNPTGAELTVNQNHVLTDAEIIGKVSGHGPGTLAVVSKPATATAGNAGNAVVRVTYPDTSTDTVNVPIKVKDVTGPSITANGATVTRKEAITAIPVTVADNTGGVGLRGQNPVQVTGLPTGLSYANNQITGTPTAAKGDYPVTIKAYDKNDNPTTKTITIKVQDQTDKYNPTGAELTVNQNHVLTDAEITGKVTGHGPGTLTVLTKPSTATAGDAGNGVVRVTYPDTTNDIVTVRIKVKDVTGPSITANGATVTRKEAITAIPVTVADNQGGRGLRQENPVQVTGLPEGLTYANGEITGTPTAPKGDYTVTITAYDKDDNPTTETITIKVQEQTDKYNPTGEELTVDQNHVLTDAEITAKVKDFGPGTLAVESKPSTATVGDAGNAVVKVTYPDGSSDTVNVPVKVRDVTGPSITANGATVTRKEAITAIPVTVADNTGGVGLRGQNPVQVTGLPTGLSYANNQITGTPTATKGDYPVTIKAYDKNDNPTTKTITIKVQDQTDKYNPTGAELTVNQNHVLTDAEITGKVTGHGPGTLTVLTKPSTATAGDAGNGVVRVTYPDTTNDIVTVRIKVKDVTGPSITANGATVTRKEAITAIPVTVADNTGGVGLRGQNPVQVTGLPTGLSYANNQITGTPTAAKGDYPVTIKAYDKNDNPTTKTITIKVQDQTDKYNPTGAELTVNQNHVLTDAEITAKVKDFGPGTLAVESKPSTATVGDAGNAVVKVTYPDGSSDTVNVPVKVRDVTGPSITANGATVTRKEAITAIPVTVADNQGGRGLRQENPVQVTGLPEGLTYANGEITGTPTAPKGDYTVTITAYDKDDNPTTETITIKVQEQTDKYNPTGEELTVDQNHVLTDAEITAKVKDFGPGTLAVESKPSTATVGDAGNAVVKVTYSDGSSDTVNVPVKVRDVTGPTITANGATVTKNEPITAIPVTVADNQGGRGLRKDNPVEVTGLPDGLTYANGEITGTPTAPKGDYTVTITAYDKDDNPTTETITIKVQEQTDKYNPAGEELTVDQNHVLTDAEITAKVKDFGPGTLAVESKPSTATVGDAGNAVVKVTYSDGSSDTVNVPVKVRDVTGPTITANGATVTKNEPITAIPVTVADNQGGRGLRKDNPVEVTGLPDGLTYANGEITGTPTAPKGDYTVTITAYDKDDNPTTETITIKVQEQTDKYNPAGEELTVDQNHVLTDAEITAKVKDFGPGTLAVESKPSTATVGDAGNAVVKVTYPDGSSDTVNVPVKVRDVTGPTITANGATVTKNEPIMAIPVTVADNQGGRGLRKDNPVQVTGLPEGLTYANGEITGTPTAPKGDYTVTITAYDKDDNPTTETITIKVQEQTDKYNPAGEELTVDQNHVLTDAEITAKVKDFGPGTLAVESKPSTATVGDAGNAVVKVTYSDGSSDTVNVPVKVRDVTGPTITANGATVTKNEPITAIPVTVADNQGGRGLRQENPVQVTGLPDGLTYANGEITGTPTAPKGDYTVTITAHDKDGNSTTQTITIKVQEQTDKYNPKYDDGQGKPGTKVEIPVKEENGKPIPADTKFESDTPGITVDDKGKVTVTIPEDKNPGDEITGKVTVTYPDGSKEEIPVKVTVTKRDKDIYNPKYDDGQGKPGTKVEIPVTEENGKPIPADTKFESDTPGITVDDKGKVTVTIPEDKNPGDEITGKVTVTYPDGSKEEIPVKVTVTKRDKDIYNPKYDDGQGKPGTKVEIPVKEENGKPIPADTKFESDTPGITVDDKGKVTVTIPEDKNPGDEITGKVTVTYPDGSKEEIPVKVTVTKRDKDIYNPKYDDGQGKPGTKVEIPVKEENGKPIPADTKFESDTPGITVDDKGKVTVTIPEDKNPGDEITGKVTVTYPDGSKEEIPVKVTVTKRDKDIYNPKYDDGQGKPGTKVEIPVKEENGKPIPADTKFESDTPGITVDDKGKVTVTIPEDKNPGDEITGKVTVTYPDGSKEEIPVKVTVTKRDKDIYNPKYDDGQGKPGTKVEIPVKEENGKPIPEGTKFESDTPGITVDDKGKVTVTIPEDKNPGDEITGKVTVTYPDGSKEEIPVKVTVTKRDKDIYNPKYDDGQGKPGTKVEIPVKEENGKPIPADTKFESDTPGITVDDKGKVTVTIPEDKNPGDEITGKVTVTYPDGSKEEIPVKVTVTKRDKDIYNPKYDDGQGKPGTKVEIPVKEENGKPIPADTKFESDTPGITVDDKGKVTVTIPEDKNPGDEITGKVTVTYPDGSKEEIPVKVTVTKRDKDIYNPKYDDGQGKPGTKVEIPVKEENGKPIPADTKFESDTPGITVDDKGKVTVTIPEDKNPGDEITGKVTVTYPDGSKEEIPVKVTVTKRDKDIYNPKYDDGQGKPGTKVEIPVKEENGKPIPADTKFESDTPGITVDDKGKVTVTIPEDKNPGDEITGKVTVTYPDGSKEEIPVKVTVTKRDKDIYNPKYDDGQGKPGTKVEIPVKEENGKPIPADTKFESDTPGITVDDKGKVTVTIPEDKNPGDEITGKVTVTYPDGSKEEIPVKVTVTKRDKDIYNPKYDDGQGKPGTKVEIPVKEENGKPIPADTKFESDTPGITVDDKGKVTVTIPEDKNPGDEITGKVTVTYPDGSKEEIPVKVTVTKRDKDIYNPKYDDGQGKPGTKVEIPVKEENGKPIPADTKFESDTPGITVDDKGKVTVTIPEDKNPGDEITGKVTVTYPDGSKEEIPVKVTVTKRDKDIYNPKYDDGQGKPGTKVEIPVKEENGKPIPADTKFESDTPGITVDDKGKVTVTIPEDKNPGDEITGKVTVTYPDGSKEEIPVKVTVTKRDKDIYNPKYDDGQGKPGTKVEIPVTEEKSNIVKTTKRLANTGESETNTGLAGLGLAVLGNLLAIAKKRKEEEE